MEGNLIKITSTINSPHRSILSVKQFSKETRKSVVVVVGGRTIILLQRVATNASLHQSVRRPQVASAPAATAIVISTTTTTTRVELWNQLVLTGVVVLLQIRCGGECVVEICIHVEGVIAICYLSLLW